MGASVSASLQGAACCHNDREEHSLLNDAPGVQEHSLLNDAPIRAAASDEVVRPDGERHPAVRTVPDSFKSSSSHTAPHRTSNTSEDGQATGKAAQRVSREKFLSEPRRNSSPPRTSLPEQAVEERADRDGSKQVSFNGSDDRAMGASESGLPSEMGDLPARRASQRSVVGELNWKKPKEVARAAMKYMGFNAMKPEPEQEQKLSGRDSPHQFTVDLIELALAVCTASAGDVSALAKLANRDDRKALTRLTEFARRHKLLKDDNMLYSGSLTMKELAQAFIDNEDRAVERQKQRFAAKSRSNLSTGSSMVSAISPEPAGSREASKGRAGAQTLADLAAREGPDQAAYLSRMGSNLSKLSRQSIMMPPKLSKSNSSLGGGTRGATYSRTVSDLSCTSFGDFNRKKFLGGGDGVTGEAAPSLMEYLSTMAANEGEGHLMPLGETGPGGTTNLVMNIQLPKSPNAASQHTDLSALGANAGTASWASEGAMTYHSSTDMVIGGDGDEKEVVQAEVLNVAGEEASGCVRIAFRSRCLRTQNEWQRHLLQQQRSLLQIARQRKEAAELELRQHEEVKEEQKELLRGFRKIIQRDLYAWEEVHRATIFVVEKNDELRNDVQELCRIMKYPCECFRHLASAQKSLEHTRMAGIPSRRPSRNDGDEKPLLEGRPGEDVEDWRVGALLSSPTHSSSGANASLAMEDSPLKIVIIGAQWLERPLPDAWKQDSNIAVVLASEAEEFEDVGRKLLASGEAEIRERLRERGIVDYLLHPLSLESLQAVISKAVHQRFGDEYLLIGALGRGNSGIVHEAKRLRDSASFALKEIPTGRLGSAAKRDVEQEAQLLQELKWPTVLFVVDAWENKQAHLRFLLMPLLKGGNLLNMIEAARRDGQRLSPDSVANWYAQTLHGLTYLHWRGILHRDLKPGNLFLAENQEAVQIGDLGSAALMPGPGPHPVKRTVVRGSVTTPSYSPPEVWQERSFMAASDIWAVGASFFEVMAMETLFVGDTSSHMEEVICAFDIENPSNVPGRNTAGRALASLRDSNMGPPAAEVAELLRQDPLRRPMAAALAKRPATAHRMRNVLGRWALAENKLDKQAHFASFDRMVSESEAAFDLPPHVAEEPDTAATRRARKRAARNSVISNASSTLGVGGVFSGVETNRSFSTLTDRSVSTSFSEN